MTAGIPAGGRRLLFLAALLLVPAAVAGWFAGGAPSVVGVAFGGATALLNLWFLSRLVARSTAADQTAPGALVAQLMLKFATLGVAMAVAVFVLGLDGLGLLLGLSVTFAAVPLNLFSEWAAGQRSGHRSRGER